MILVYFDNSYDKIKIFKKNLKRKLHFPRFFQVLETRQITIGFFLLTATIYYPNVQNILILICLGICGQTCGNDISRHFKQRRTLLIREKT